MNDKKRATIMKALDYEFTISPLTFSDVAYSVLTDEFMVDVDHCDLELRNGIDKIVNDFFTKLDLNKHAVEKLLLFHKILIIAKHDNIMSTDLVKLKQFCNPYLKGVSVISR